jgi:CRP-like cAMP-binding protein
MVAIERLRAFPAFSGLPEALLGRLAEAMKEEEISSGTVIFSEGKGGDAVYFILKGEVLIRKTVDKASEAYKVIALLSTGEFFGEMALLEHLPRSAAAVAQSPVTVLKLSTDDFQKLLETDPAAALKFFKGLVTTLSARLRQTTREMVAVFEVGRTLVQELDVRSLSGRILSFVKNSFEADDVFGVFFYWNEFTAEYELLAVEGDPPADFRKARPKTDVMLHTMAVKRECVLSRTWPGDSRFSDTLHNDWKGAVSLLAAPVVGLKGPVGYMMFGHPSKPDVFTSGHRQVLAGVCNLVAPAFENAAWRQEMESRRRLERTRTISY